LHHNLFHHDNSITQASKQQKLIRIVLGLTLAYAN